MYFNDKDKEAFVVATITVLRWLLRVSSILQTTKNLIDTHPSRVSSYLVQIFTFTDLHQLTMKTIQILAFVGILVSFYALYVESKTGTKDAMGKPYEAMCDTKIFGYVVSCSKVFESKYGKMLSLFGIVPNILPAIFDVPNAAIGVVFYVCAIILPYLRCLNKQTKATIMFAASTLSCCVCVYLACILAFVLQDFCIVCASTYVVNALVWVQSLRDYCNSGKAKTN
jgi:vitamin-K-epoxide reductase (warfarin-sensitive)